MVPDPDVINKYDYDVKKLKKRYVFLPDGDFLKKRVIVARKGLYFSSVCKLESIDLADVCRFGT